MRDILFFSLMLMVLPLKAEGYGQELSSIKKEVTVDTSKYEITYSMKFKYSKNDKKYHSDTRIMQIGKRFVKDYSEMQYHYDSLATENFRKGKTTPSMPDHFFPYEVCNNIAEKVATVNYRTFYSFTFCYKTPKKPQVWQLVADTSITVLGHHCNMAKVNYAGRTYTAWYAMDIPLHYGPYKFAGLPGLIMKIEDADKKYVWIVTGIVNKQRPIKEYIYAGTKNTTSEKASAIVKKMFKDPAAYMTSCGAKLYEVKNEKLVRITNSEEMKLEEIEIQN